jgi:hypothetical protein
MNKKKSLSPSKQQWGAVASAAGTMAYVSGPLGAAVTAIGATTGCVIANWMTWTPDDGSNESSAHLTP